MLELLGSCFYPCLDSHVCVSCYCTVSKAKILHKALLLFFNKGRTDFDKRALYFKLSPTGFRAYDLCVLQIQHSIHCASLIRNPFSLFIWVGINSANKIEKISKIILFKSECKLKHLSKQIQLWFFLQKPKILLAIQESSVRFVPVFMQSDYEYFAQPRRKCRRLRRRISFHHHRILDIGRQEMRE